MGVRIGLLLAVCACSQARTAPTLQVEMQAGGPAPPSGEQDAALPASQDAAPPDMLDAGREPPSDAHVDTAIAERVQLGLGLALTDNPVLGSLHALSVLSTVDNVYIERNPMLPQCEIDWFLSRVPYDPQWSNQVDNGPAGACEP